MIGDQMKKEEYGLTTFKSTHYAIQAEKSLKENDIFFKTDFSVSHEKFYLNNWAKIYESANATTK